MARDSGAVEPARTRRLWAAITAFAVAISIIATGPEPTSAATTVSVCPSCAHTTIQDAIDAAGPGDTIAVASGTFFEEIIVSKDLTIIGAGAGSTVVQGDGSGTVVEVLPGVTASIQELQVTGGSATHGGGILNKGSLTVGGVAVHDNVALDSSTVASGGGIANEGSLTVRDGLIANNGADRGGGIWNRGGTVVIVDSTIVGNVARNYGGGGIASALSTGAVTIRGSVIEANSVTNPGTDQRGGGGIWASQSDLTVEDSTIVDNDSGYSAGGIYVSGSTATMLMLRSTVSGNQTGTARGTGNGGGISVRDSSRSTIDQSTISANIGASSGGGIDVRAPLTVSNSTVSGNSAAGYGGGISVSSSLTLNSVTVAANQADNGGGLASNSVTSTVENTIIAANTATTSAHDCVGTITSSTTALLETNDCTTSGTGTFTIADARLGPLADNGGPTLTHLPAIDSPALDRGDTALSFDQRGPAIGPRPSGFAADIGAVEVQVGPQAQIEVDPDWGAVGGWAVIRALPIDGASCGFTDGETIELLWDETLLGTTDADADGCFEDLVELSGERLAGSEPGPHKIIAQGADSGAAAQAPFEQVPHELFATPTVAGPGSPVAVDGCGWEPDTRLTVFWLATGDAIGRADVDSTGCISGEATLPRALPGLYAIGVSPGSVAPEGPPDTSATALRIAPATFTVFPKEGPPGTQVEIAGSEAWYPGEQVEFSWEPNGEALATFATDQTGTITRTANAGLDLVFDIPFTASLGSAGITATGITSGQAHTQPFDVVESGLNFDPAEAEPGTVVAAFGCGWTGNSTVRLEWGATDPNGRTPAWIASVDPVSGCFGDGGSFTFTVPDDTRAGEIEVTATGDVEGSALSVFTVISGTIRVNGGGWGCCNLSAGADFEIEVTGAIIGEIIEFYLDDASSEDPDLVATAGVTTPDFTVDATVPLDAWAGSGDILAIGSKGFDADYSVFVSHGFLDIDESRPFYGGNVFTVEGTGFASGEEVELGVGFTRNPTIVTVAEGETSFIADVEIPLNTQPGPVDVHARGSFGRSVTREIQIRPLPFDISADNVNPIGIPPRIDGVISTGEWDLTDTVALGDGTASFTSDANRLYVLVNLTGDDGNDPIPSGDTFFVIIDVDGDGDIDPGRDLRMTLGADGTMVVDEFAPGGGFSRQSIPFLESTAAAGFDCFFDDGSAVMDPNTGATTCDAHRVWEIAIDLPFIDAQEGDVVRIGIGTESQSPSISDTLPADATTELRGLGVVRLDDVNLPSPIPAGDVIGIGSDGFDIEVTQAVQTVGNTLRLAAGKDTVVRVYPDVVGDSLVRVYLYGERNSDGTDLPGSPIAAMVNVPDDIDRSQLRHTANFLLPTSWTEAGFVNLIARVESFDGTQVIATQEIVAFQEREPFTVWVFPIPEVDTSDGAPADATILPTDADMAAQESVASLLLPTDTTFVRRAPDELGFLRTPDPDESFGAEEEALDDYYTALEQAAASSSQPADLPDMLYGFTANSDGTTLGSSSTLWGGGRQRVAAGEADGRDTNTMTLIHELNHNLDPNPSGTWGRHVGDPDSDVDDPDYGCDANGTDTAWPTPGDDSVGEIGFDTRLPWLTGGDSSGTPYTVVPESRDDFMSYCRQSPRPIQWISPYRWEALFSRFTPTTSGASLQSSPRLISAFLATENHVFYVSGSVGIDGEGTLDPIVTFDGTPTELETSGDYRLEVLDASGQVLSARSFPLSFVSVEGDPRDIARFRYELPASPNAASIVLLHNNEVLDRVAASQNAPTVVVTSPSGGESWSGTATISWAITDPDGGTFTSNVFYSPNGSATWYPIARDVAGTSTTVDVSLLPGGSEGKIRVVVSDGFHTGQDVSEGTFTVPTPDARVTISLPTDGSFFVPGSVFAARGAAVEVDGTVFEGDQLVWLVDGAAVGTGESIELSLSDGPHEVSLLAVDETGIRGRASVNVTMAVPLAPTVSATPSTQVVDHSDAIVPVAITATDPDASGMRLVGVPYGMSVAKTCVPNGASGETCTWKVSGVADLAAETYEVAVRDGDFEIHAFELTVVAEAVTVAFPGSNPTTVPVVEPGSDSSEPFDITVRFAETEPDVASGEPLPGDLGRADPVVELVPIAGGGDVAPKDCEVVRIDGDGYDAELTYRCSFDAVPVGIYAVVASVEGGFYAGAGEDVLAVVDPSLGSTSGSGSIEWPGTDDRTTFAFTMEYNKSGKNVRGSLMMVRHTENGRHILKSNALDGLSLGTSGGAKWAAFSGKATYVGPAMSEPEGNHEFVAYVEDDGSGDRFWIEIRDKADVVIAETSMTRPAEDHAVDLTSGDVVIPSGGGGPRPN